MDSTLRSQVESALGQPVKEARPVTGGDISAAYLVKLADGERVFVKSKAGVPRDFFRSEATGLEWLRETGALRLPRALAVGDDFLALEYLESGARREDFDQALGRGLAALHRNTAAKFGFEHSNYIGSLPQSNTPRARWVDFLVEQRLRPLVRMAITKRGAPKTWESRFDNLYRALPGLLPDESPSRLHGDLWGGNLLVGPGGEPCLIDPSVYAGHREVDLAMMRLFGGFGDRVFASYHEAFPLKDGHQRRVHLYQLYPLLVHVNLFGGGYLASVERSLTHLGF